MLLLVFVAAAAGPAVVAPRLSDWMGDLLPIIGNSTLFDLSVVRTHNTGSQRMTTTISDNSEQITAEEASIIHDITVTKLGAATVGRFTQLWAIVQGQDFIDQLDAGVRFIDFRMIYTAPWNSSSAHAHDWYINHRAQTKETAMWYLRALRACTRRGGRTGKLPGCVPRPQIATLCTPLRTGMDAHPREILRMRVSRHAGDTFPGTPDSALENFFSGFVDLFGDVLHDHTRYPSANTTVGELVRGNQRMHVSLAAYAQMTKNGTAKGSHLVNEGVSIQECGSFPDLSDLRASFSGTLAACFYSSSSSSSSSSNSSSATDTAADTAAASSNTLSSLSLARDPHTSTYVAAGEVFAAGPLAATLGLVSKCAKTLDAGGLLFSGKWCPGSILEYEHLQGYWDQFLLEDFVANYTKWPAAHLPNIIEVNAFGANGTLEIDAGPGKRYALLDTVLLANVRRACGVRGRAAATAAMCEETEEAILARRGQFPMQREKDVDRGRQMDLRAQ